MPPSNTNDTVKVSEEEIPSTNTFNFFGSVFLAEGRTEGDCKNILRLSWNKSRETTGAICDKKVPIKLRPIQDNNQPPTSYTVSNVGP